MMDLILKWIDIPYLTTFILASYLILKNLKGKEIKLWKIVLDKTYLVLFIALFLAIPFSFLIEGETNIVIMKILVTYTAGTSFYELIVKKIIKYFEK